MGAAGGLTGAGTDPDTDTESATVSERSMTRLWLLNFDADEELARPAGYTPSRAMTERAAALSARVGPLLGPGDLLLGEGVRAAGRAGRAFCPTPRAIRALERAGATAPPAPPLEVLRRVNHRRFCAELGQTLPGARYVETIEALERAIIEFSPTGQWLLKRPFGFAGRGRRKVAAGALEPGSGAEGAPTWRARPGAPSVARATRAWVMASLASGGGLQVEPWVERRGDLCMHGFIAQRGTIALGEACAQSCDEHGAWLETRRAAAGELDPVERQALLEAAREAGEALAEAGYFGPFGVDAFRWVDEAGGVRLNARCEINARYTMGWAVGMGDLRPDLE